MTVQLVTAALLLGMFIAVGAVDIALQYAGQATVSQVIRGWSASWPILPFAAGVLVGHLFWSGGAAVLPLNGNLLHK